MPSHALAFCDVLVVKLPRQGLVERRPITQCVGVFRQLKLLIPHHDQIVRDNLIRRVSTLDEVARIQKEGAAKRKEAEAELGRIEGELKQKLMELRG